MSTLAEQQAALVRALVARAEVPAGFDPARIDATLHSLLRKRAGDVAMAWPLLMADHSTRARFMAWADGRPKTTSYGDGLAFAREGLAAGRLSDDAAAELHGRTASPRPGLRARLRQLIMR